MHFHLLQSKSIYCFVTFHHSFWMGRIVCMQALSSSRYDSGQTKIQCVIFEAMDICHSQTSNVNSSLVTMVVLMAHLAFLDCPSDSLVCL